MPERPEPNGWELSAGIDRIEKKIDTMSKGFVPNELFTTVIAQMQQDRTDDRARIQKLETEQLDAQKVKNQNWFAIVCAVVAAIAAVVVPIIILGHS